MATQLWSRRPLLSWDTETTGVDPDTDRIVEVALATIDVDGTVLDSWSTIVDPGIEIPEGAAAVHGITTERARLEGIEPELALATLADRIYEVAAIPSRPIVAHNVAFDLPIILAEADRHDVDVPAFAPYLDSLVIDKAVDRYRKGSRRLIDVARHYGVALEESQAHGALADCIAAGRIMRALLATYPALAEKPLAALWLWQGRWAEEQRESFVDYRRRTSDPTFDKPAGWPVPATTPGRKAMWTPERVS